MKQPVAAEKRQAPRPERVKLSREEVLKPMSTISEGKEKTLLAQPPGVKERRKLVKEGWAVFHISPRELKEALKGDLFDAR